MFWNSYDLWTRNVTANNKGRMAAAVIETNSLKAAPAPSISLAGELQQQRPQQEPRFQQRRLKLETGKRQTSKLEIRSSVKNSRASICPKNVPENLNKPAKILVHTKKQCESRLKLENGTEETFEFFFKMMGKVGIEFYLTRKPNEKMHNQPQECQENSIRLFNSDSNTSIR